MTEEIKEQSRLSYLKSTLTEQLDVTEKLTSEIRARLIAMHKWDEPSNGCAVDKKETAGDALSEIIDQTERLRESNNRLDMILRHLSKII